MRSSRKTTPSKARFTLKACLAGLAKALQSLVAGEHALERMTPEQAQTRVAFTVASLKRMWDEEYDRNIATVDHLLEQMAGRHPGLGIDASVRLDDGRDVPLLELLDSFYINSLLEFAKHRAGRRQSALQPHGEARQGDDPANCHGLHDEHCCDGLTSHAA